MRISQEMKGVIMRNLCGTIFYIKTSVLHDFRICMSVPLKLIETLKHRAPNDQSLVLEKPNVIRNVKPKPKKIKFNG